MLNYSDLNIFGAKMTYIAEVYHFMILKIHDIAKIDTL